MLVVVFVRMPAEVVVLVRMPAEVVVFPRTLAVVLACVLVFDAEVFACCCAEMQLKPDVCDTTIRTESALAQHASFFTAGDASTYTEGRSFPAGTS
jgi:hypothetical protein